MYIFLCYFGRNKIFRWDQRLLIETGKFGRDDSHSHAHNLLINNAFNSLYKS